MTGHAAVWRRACPAGQALDLLHARVAEPYAPHVHERVRGRRVHRGPGGDPLPRDTALRGAGQRGGPGARRGAHRGPGRSPDFTYRVMYPAERLLTDGLLAEGLLAGGSGPRARRCRGSASRSSPIPGWRRAALELHAALGAGLGETEPLEAETRLSWLLGSWSGDTARRPRRRGTRRGPGGPAGDGAAGRPAGVPARAAPRSPPRTGLSRYQLVRSFRTEVGMPPYAWLAQHRVSQARVLLERGCRPAEARRADRVRRTRRT